MNDEPMVIAIDGPAGSGKSTVARAVAARLGLDYLDTGAMYRSVAFAALRGGVDPEDTEVVGNLARNIDLDVDPGGSVVVDGVDATIEIRGPEVTRAVRIVAANPEVRAEMRARQRRWVAERVGESWRDVTSALWCSPMRASRSISTPVPRFVPLEGPRRSPISRTRRLPATSLAATPSIRVDRMIRCAQPMTLSSSIRATSMWNRSSTPSWTTSHESTRDPHPRGS